MMKFCVMVKMARRSISFWYQSDGNPYAPLSVRGSNEVPLYFYVNGNDFVFGNTARERFVKNDPHAYGNYFEIIKDPGKHFVIYGNKKPVKQLLYHGVEYYLSHFINAVLYRPESIESHRPHFPLRFIYDTDIQDNEKSLIEQLFQEAGYLDIERIDYNQLLFKVLLQKGGLYRSKAILLLNGIDDVLYLQLYRDATAQVIGSVQLDGHGADPRVKILASMIIEYILTQHSYLSVGREEEVAFLLPFCAQLLDKDLPIIQGDVELSNGSSYWFKITRRNLNVRLQYYPNQRNIYSAIDDLLKLGSLHEKDVVVLLGSEEINTSYFSEQLLRKYSYVKGIENVDVKAVMKMAFDESARPAKTVRPTLPSIPSQPTTPPALPKVPPKKELEKPKLPPLPQKPKEVKTPISLPPLPPKKTT